MKMTKAEMKKAQARADKNPLPTVPQLDLVADGIVALSRAVQNFRNSRFKTEAIVVLLADATRRSKNECRDLLATIEGLENRYLK